MKLSRLIPVSLLATAAALAPAVHAEVTPQRTWNTLVSSNGHGAIVVNLAPTGDGAQIHHFREHIFATEEPLIDEQGNDVFINGYPQSVFARDLLYDTYFGLRANGTQRWIKSLPVVFEASGFEGTIAGATGGTGIIRMVQRWNDLEVTQYVFAPWGLEHAAFAMIAKVRNTGSSPQQNVSVFSLHNFHLGFGRPGPQHEIGENGETIVYNGAKDAFEERAFAGVVVTRALSPSSRHGASRTSSPASENVWQIVENGGTTDLPNLDGEAPTGDGSVSAFQKDLGTLQPGQEAWFGVVNAHHGDPFAASTVQGWLDSWIAGRSPQSIVDDERAAWASFQDSLTVPSGLTPEEQVLFRQSAVVLRMAQVREDSMFLRDKLTSDSDQRRTRFTSTGGGPATLPGMVKHRGKGAVLASLPPGEWTYAWPRDGSYAIVGMALAGMKEEAREALRFYLDAEGGRFQHYNELSSYNMPAYLISLTRYHGGGVEETDYNDFGPNLEFDGFGLFLWALQTYTKVTGDTTLRTQYFDLFTTKVADALVSLIDPATGLIRKDSSIWETHWNGRERTFAFTSITAARGLCDAAEMARAEGNDALATQYATAAESLREAIATKLTDVNGAIAATAEELSVGHGYWDAAVLDAIAMGLFNPQGRIATATLQGIEANLRTPAGVGWSRNDDGFDHHDLSPWGGPYDNAEWVFTDMRGAVALREAGQTSRSDALVEWIRRQAAVNYLEIAETYDENTAAYKFNAPMVGFGSGAWIIATSQAKGSYQVDPACGGYYDESAGGAGGSGGGGSAGAGGSAGQGQGGQAGEAGSGSGGDAGHGGQGHAGQGQGGDGGSSAGAGGNGQAGSAGEQPDAGVAGSAGDGQPQPLPAAEEEDDSCGCRVAGSQANGWSVFGALAALMMAGLRRRRRG